MDKNRCLLSIIIPAYNMEKYLERCLSSLVVDENQMCLFEVLVINDGSKDRTSEIGHRFENNYPKTFRTIDKENGHYGSCINCGLAAAKGIFVKVLDADDTFDPVVFPKFLHFLSGEDVQKNGDVILSDYIQVDEKLVLLSKHLYSNYSNPVKICNLTREDREKWFIHGLTYRIHYLRDIHHKQTEGIAYTDIEWCFYPIVKLRNLYRFEGALYRYTKLREDQSVNPAVQGKNIGMQVRVVKKMIRDFPAITKDCLDDGNQSFLHDYITLQVSHIYQLFLLTLHQHIKSSDRLLQDFDFDLQQYAPDLYQEIEGYSTRVAGIHFEPIKDWRGHKVFKMKLMQTLYSMADFKVRMSRIIKSGR